MARRGKKILKGCCMGCDFFFKAKFFITLHLIFGFAGFKYSIKSASFKSKLAKISESFQSNSGLKIRLLLC